MTIREECVSHTLFLCMMHEIYIPYTVISSVARNLFRPLFPTTPSLSLLGEAPSPPFLRYGVSHFSLSGTLPLTANEKDPSAPLGMTLRKWRFPNIPFIRDVGYPSPHTVISSAVEKSSLHSALSCSFRKRFPLFRAFLFPSQKHSRFLLSHIRRYAGVQERSRASLGMTLREYRSLTLPIYFPCNNDTREAPSTFAALLFFMRRTTPLNPTT